MVPSPESSFRRIIGLYAFYFLVKIYHQWQWAFPLFVDTILTCPPCHVVHAYLYNYISQYYYCKIQLYSGYRALDVFLIHRSLTIRCHEIRCIRRLLPGTPSHPLRGEGGGRVESGSDTLHHGYEHDAVRRIAPRHAARQRAHAPALHRRPHFGSRA